MTGDTLRVCSIYDPIKDPQIRTNDNPFVGFFGYVRCDGNDYHLIPHTGYDYKADVGTAVVAVQSGKIERIRFGRKDVGEYYEYNVEDKKYYKRNGFICPLLKLFKSGTNFFDHEECRKCSDKYYLCDDDNERYEIIDIDDVKNKKVKVKSISENCFGVQVWLKIIKVRHGNVSFQVNKHDSICYEYDTGLYAYYAHLSVLNNVEEIRSKFFADIGSYSKLPKFCSDSDLFIQPNSVLTIDNLIKSKKELVEDLIKPEQYIYPKSTIVLDTFSIRVMAGDILGQTGCTGNAYNMTEGNKHLHFECRKGIDTGTQINPNHIVKTPFVIANCKNHDIVDVAENQKRTREELLLVKKMNELEWKRALKKIMNEFENRCMEEEWKLYKATMTKDRFENEIWRGEHGLKKSKWNNFKFISEKSLLEKERDKWNAFIKEKRKDFDLKWVVSFRTNYKIIPDPRNRKVIFK